jgi:hypothetical protein
MGFFSWKTADTKESIPNIYSGKRIRTVYLLQPSGLPPIVEEGYKGYGDFGCVDAFVWLAKANLSESVLASLSVEEIRTNGIALDCANASYEYSDGKQYLIQHDYRALFPDAVFLNVHFDKPVGAFGGKTANEAIDDGTLKKIHSDVRYPLKFSFNPDAVYKDLPASESCEYQGYFYD